MASCQVYDEVSHEWDEQVNYFVLPEYKDCFIIYPRHLRPSYYRTEHKNEMKELCNEIRDSAMYDTQEDIFIIKENMLMDILENFYKKGNDKVSKKVQDDSIDVGDMVVWKDGNKDFAFIITQHSDNRFTAMNRNGGFTYFTEQAKLEKIGQVSDELHALLNSIAILPAAPGTEES